MPPNELTYEDGLHEGRLRGIEETISKHGGRLDNHETRIASQEKIIYAILAVVALMQMAGIIQKLFM